MRINILSLPIKFTKKKKWILASCPILDVYSQGETIEEAKKNIKDALTGFLTTCYEMGTFDSVLEKAGLEPVVVFSGFYPPSPQKTLSQYDDFVNIDLSFIDTALLADIQLKCLV
ncbi:type II toxin-antitoxin system HicB family antitoxin [bacterium]|nr:type II toxin-antitoxin system HicB family antitoxin [bacterium]